MFDAPNSLHILFISCIAFALLLFIRQRFIQQKKYICLFHTSLFMVLFIAIVGGGGAQNDAYQRLEQFIHLEAVGQLETARAHPENYDSMLQIDFTAFKDSHEFKNYIKEHDSIIDQAVAIGIGWLFVFLSEVVLLLINLVTLILKRKQS